MISKLSATDDLNLRKWGQEVQREFNNYIQTLDVPVSKSGIIGNYVHGKHPTKQLTVGNSAYFGFIIPHSLANFREVTIRFIPTVTGTINYTVNLSYGGVGEDENTNQRTTSVTGVAVTDDEISELNITTLFTMNDTTDQPDRGDQMGCELVLDAATTTTDIQVISLYLKYF